MLQKQTKQIWILLAKSFSIVVSELSQPLRLLRELIFDVIILGVQSSCMQCAIGIKALMPPRECTPIKSIFLFCFCNGTIYAVDVVVMSNPAVACVSFSRNHNSNSDRHTRQSVTYLLVLDVYSSFQSTMYSTHNIYCAYLISTLQFHAKDIIRCFHNVSLSTHKSVYMEFWKYPLSILSKLQISLPNNYNKC